MPPKLGHLMDRAIPSPCKSQSLATENQSQNK
jgi:hypothetical protein